MNGHVRMNSCSTCKTKMKTRKTRSGDSKTEIIHIKVYVSCYKLVSRIESRDPFLPLRTNKQKTVGTGGSPKNWSVWWCKCNKTLLFTVFSAHTQIAFMLMLREHMPCLFATRGSDDFSWHSWIHFHHNISKLHSLACLRDMLSIVHV